MGDTKTGELLIVCGPFRGKWGKQYVKIKCSCGRIYEIQYASLKKPKKYKMCKICTDKINSTLRKNGYGISGKKDKLYVVWLNMRKICYNDTCKGYIGGNGITIYPKWKEFRNFRKWSNDCGYDENKTLIRIDKDGNFCPDNCKWVNKSLIPKVFIYRGEYYNLEKLFKKFNCTIDKELVLKRLANGWGILSSILISDVFNTSVLGTDSMAIVERRDIIKKLANVHRDAHKFLLEGIDEDEPRTEEKIDEFNDQVPEEELKVELGIKPEEYYRDWF